MSNKNLIRQLENYFAENFIEPKPLPAVSKFLSDITNKNNGLMGAIRWQLDKIFDKPELKGNFGQRISYLIEKKGLTEVELYKRVQLYRRIFSKIRR